MLGKGKTSSEAPPEEGMLGRVLGKRNVQNLPPGSSVLLDDHIYILSSQARTLKENSTSLEKTQLSGWHPGGKKNKKEEKERITDDLYKLFLFFKLLLS